MNKKKAFLGSVATVTAAAILLSGTFAWNNISFHASTDATGDGMQYSALLLEDYQQIDDWSVTNVPTRTHRVAVTNNGIASQGFGNVYTRLQIKEYMETTDVLHEYSASRFITFTASPASNSVNLPGSLATKDGEFIRVPYGADDDVTTVFATDANGVISATVTADDTAGDGVTYNTAKAVKDAYRGGVANLTNWDNTKTVPEKTAKILAVAYPSGTILELDTVAAHTVAPLIQDPNAPAGVTRMIPDLENMTGADGSLLQTNYIVPILGDPTICWYLVGSRSDINGGYGKYVLGRANESTGAAATPIVGGSTRATDADRDKNFNDHTHIPYSTEECKYPVHAWVSEAGANPGDPATLNPDRSGATSAIREYISWTMGNDVILLENWDGIPTKQWILDTNATTGTNGQDGYFAYWGDKLAPGETTSTLTDTITLIQQPEGNFYYSTHVEFEALAGNQLAANWDENGANTVFAAPNEIMASYNRYDVNKISILNSADASGVVTVHAKPNATNTAVIKFGVEGDGIQGVNYSNFRLSLTNPTGSLTAANVKLVTDASYVAANHVGIDLDTGTVIVPASITTDGTINFVISYTNMNSDVVHSNSVAVDGSHVGQAGVAARLIVNRSAMAANGLTMTANGSNVALGAGTHTNPMGVSIRAITDDASVDTYDLTWAFSNGTKWFDNSYAPVTFAMDPAGITYGNTKNIMVIGTTAYEARDKANDANMVFIDPVTFDVTVGANVRSGTFRLTLSYTDKVTGASSAFANFTVGGTTAADDSFAVGNALATVKFGETKNNANLFNITGGQNFNVKDVTWAVTGNDMAGTAYTAANIPVAIATTDKQVSDNKDTKIVIDRRDGSVIVPEGKVAGYYTITLTYTKTDGTTENKTATLTVLPKDGTLVIENTNLATNASFFLGNATSSTGFYNKESAANTIIRVPVTQVTDQYGNAYNNANLTDAMFATAQTMTFKDTVRGTNFMPGYADDGLTMALDSVKKSTAGTAIELSIKVTVKDSTKIGVSDIKLHNSTGTAMNGNVIMQIVPQGTTAWAWAGTTGNRYISEITMDNNAYRLDAPDASGEQKAVTVRNATVVSPSNWTTAARDARVVTPGANFSRYAYEVTWDDADLNAAVVKTPGTGKYANILAATNAINNTEWNSLLAVTGAVSVLAYENAGITDSAYGVLPSATIVAPWTAENWQNNPRYVGAVASLLTGNQQYPTVSFVNFGTPQR